MEIDLVFKHLPLAGFSKGLEIGCGDGYQTTLLRNRFKEFVACDLNFKRIKEELKISNVVYKQYDADNLEGVFQSEEFDFIFSSNVMEHLSRPRQFLNNTRFFLKNDGYVVHIVPSRFLKITYIFLHFINLVVLVINRTTQIFFSRGGTEKTNLSMENNINKSVLEKKNKLSQILFPQIHGNFDSHIEEFIKFGKKEWQKMFEESGFNVVRYVKGPAFSGYGFGFNRLRKLLHYLWWSSEHIFILKKVV
ncbi:MAG: class I SAM-dependent methyltransferase [Patescibacteria group bacterium]